MQGICNWLKYICRLFYLGRTETIHPVSEHSVAFVKAVDDPGIPRDEVKDLLRKAVEHQTQFKLQATSGHGCDRHLLGLYCAAREIGMDIPQIFRDKVWWSYTQYQICFNDISYFISIL